MTGEGDDEGREDGRWREGGKGDGSPHPRGQRRGEGGSRTAPTGRLVARLNVTGDDEGRPYVEETDSLNSQTECNTLLGCCHGKAI